MFNIELSIKDDGENIGCALWSSYLAFSMFLLVLVFKWTELFPSVQNIYSVNLEAENQA